MKIFFNLFFMLDTLLKVFGLLLLTSLIVLSVKMYKILDSVPELEAKLDLTLKNVNTMSLEMYKVVPILTSVGEALKQNNTGGNGY